MYIWYIFLHRIDMLLSDLSREYSESVGRHIQHPELGTFRQALSKKDSYSVSLCWTCRRIHKQMISVHQNICTTRLDETKSLLSKRMSPF